MQSNVCRTMQHDNTSTIFKTDFFSLALFLKILNSTEHWAYKSIANCLSGWLYRLEWCNFGRLRRLLPSIGFHMELKCLVRPKANMYFLSTIHIVVLLCRFCEIAKEFDSGSRLMKIILTFKENVKLREEKICKDGIFNVTWKACFL